MAHALQGAEAPKPTLRDEANAARIGRARFVGHAVGFTLIVLAIEIALTFAGLKETRPMGATSMTVPHHWLALAELSGSSEAGALKRQLETKMPLWQIQQATAQNATH